VSLELPQDKHELIRNEEATSVLELSRFKNTMENFLAEDAQTTRKFNGQLADITEAVLAINAENSMAELLRRERESAAVQLL
jgi:hypothetical protein